MRSSPILIVMTVLFLGTIMFAAASVTAAVDSSTIDLAHGLFQAGDWDKAIKSIEEKVWGGKKPD